MSGPFELPKISTTLDADLGPLSGKFDAGVGKAKEYVAKVDTEIAKAGKKASPIDAAKMGPLSGKFDGGVQGAKEYVQKFDAAIAQAGKKASPIDAAKMAQLSGKSGEETGKGFLAGLNDEVGRRSTFGKIAKLLAGGGVVGGLGIAAHVLDDLTVEAEKFALALDKGGDAARAGTAELLKQLPIVGKLGEAGARVWGLLSGETQYVQKVKEATAAQEAHMKIVADVAAEVRSLQKISQDVIQDAETRIARLKLSGLPLKLFDINEETKTAVKAVTDQLSDTSMIKDYQKEIDAAKDAQKKLYGVGLKASLTVPRKDLDALARGDLAVLNTNDGQHLERADAEVAVKFLDLQEKIAAATKNIAKEQNKVNEALSEAKKTLSVENRVKSIAAIAEEWKKTTAQIGGYWTWLKEHGSELFGRMIEQVRTLQADVQEKLGAVRRDVATFGMSDLQKGLFDFKGVKGVGKQQIDDYKRLIGELQGKQDGKKLTDDVEAWQQSLKGPIEKYDDLIRQITKFRDLGKISPEEFNKGVAAAKAELEKSQPQEQKRDSSKFANFVQAGSAEAVRLQFAIQNDSSASNIPQQQLQKLKDQEKLQREIRDRLNFKMK